MNKVLESAIVKKELSYIANSSSPNNLFYGQDRRDYFKDLGFTTSEFDDMQNILNQYGYGNEAQLRAENLILQELKTDSRRSQIFKEQIRLETTLHEYWVSKTSEPTKLYRRGKLGKDIESWSSNVDGADMGQGGIGYDHVTTFADRKKEGYLVLGGGSKLMGSPDEGEITLIKFKM